MYRLGFADRVLVRVACWCFYRLSAIGRYHLGKYFYDQHARIIATKAGSGGPVQCPGCGEITYAPDRFNRCPMCHARTEAFLAEQG